MFSKYVSKITNTIGAINYIQQKSKKDNEKQCLHWQHSPKQRFFDDGLDVIVEKKPNNENHTNYDLSTNHCRIHKHSPPSESQLILAAALEELRNTLFQYELVLSIKCSIFFAKFSSKKKKQ